MKFNLAHALDSNARATPGLLALRWHAGQRWHSLSFAELARDSRHLARALQERGLARGERALLFLPPGGAFVTAAYALLRIGAVPVLIDPGMGRKALLACIARAKPRALIGVPRAHLARLLFAHAFASVKLAVCHGPRPLWRGLCFQTLLEQGARLEGQALERAALEVAAEEESAILFTSGSTGPPKGVRYTHGIFAAQVELLRGPLALGASSEVHAACFPLFGLFDAALGHACIFPRIDPSRPGQCDPAKVYADLVEQGASFCFGSPAIWRRVVPWMRARSLRFERLRKVLIAGAPVPPTLVEDLLACLPLGARVLTPYGATEALPLTAVDDRELLGEARAWSAAGAGTLLGRALDGLEFALLAVSDAAHPEFDPVRDALPAGELGEICVCGPVVTPGYLDEPDQDALAKMRDAQGRLWHRMGDLGRADAAGRLWFCGRKSQRIETSVGRLAPDPEELLYDLHPSVRRSALVGLGERGSQRAVLLVEPREPGLDQAALERELQAHGARIQRRLPPPGEAGALQLPERVLLHPGFPTDARHNAKIRRELLQRWAEERLQQ